jgi:hypothetical protein
MSFPDKNYFQTEPNILTCSVVPVQYMYMYGWVVLKLFYIFLDQPASWYIQYVQYSTVAESKTFPKRELAQYLFLAIVHIFYEIQKISR